jgi:hypothetical protein
MTQNSRAHSGLLRFGIFCNSEQALLQETRADSDRLQAPITRINLKKQKTYSMPPSTLKIRQFGQGPVSRKDRKMENQAKESECLRGKTSFTAGTRLCLLNKCMTCEDGEWKVDTSAKSDARS